MNDQASTIFVCSDSVGETAEAVVRATMRQFDADRTQIKRCAHIKSEEEIRELMEEAARSGTFVVYTLVMPELREMMRQEALRLQVPAVDIMGPVMEAFIQTFDSVPKRQPGLLHRLDQDYFRRVEAVEFAVKCDDGQHAALWRDADLVLVGVSRTSKTPLSIYLAHKGYKVANYPLVPEVKPPEDLYGLAAGRLIGLTIRPESLVNIRTERLKAMGLPSDVNYASLKRVAEELEHAETLYRRLNCRILDVTDRAIEETAGTILEALRQ